MSQEEKFFAVAATQKEPVSPIVSRLIYISFGILGVLGMIGYVGNIIIERRNAANRAEQDKWMANDHISLNDMVDASNYFDAQLSALDNTGSPLVHAAQLMNGLTISSNQKDSSYNQLNAAVILMRALKVPSFLRAYHQASIDEYSVMATIIQSSSKIDDSYSVGNVPEDIIARAREVDRKYLTISQSDDIELSFLYHSAIMQHSNEFADHPDHHTISDNTLQRIKTFVEVRRTFLLSNGVTLVRLFRRLDDPPVVSPKWLSNDNTQLNLSISGYIKLAGTERKINALLKVNFESKKLEPANPDAQFLGAIQQ